MKYLLLCLAFILTTSVMAQAAESRDLKWVTNYSAQAEINGLPVRANLDVAQMNGNSPIGDVNFGQEPSRTPSEYRLNLLVSESPRVQLTFKVQPSTVYIDGTPHTAFVSDLAADQQLHFLITTEGTEGALHVDYSQIGDGNQLSVGEFSLKPVPHIL